MTNQTIDDKYYLGKKILERGFRQWFLYLFKYINGSPWKELNIHKKMFKQVAQIINGDTTRLCMNLSPRSGKTSLATWLVVYSLTINPKSQIIYTSFNQDLLSQIAQQVAAIMQHPIYKALYGQSFTEESEEVDPIDDFWRDYLVQTTGKIKFSNRKIFTPQGGVVLFNSVGSAITGFGCFSYDTVVMTKSGKLKLGDIVENKLDVEVLSYNFKTRKKEYKKIYRYVKNDQSEYIKVVLDNNEIINCTPDHIFYTRRGELRAEDIVVGDKIMANLFNLPNWYIKAKRYVFSGVVFIKNKIHLLFRKRFFDVIKRGFKTVLHSVSISYLSPNNSALYVGNRRRCYAKIFCNLLVWSGILGYLYCLCCGKFLEFSIAKKLIVSILLCCSIAKVFQSVICFYRVYMSGLKCGRTNKSKKNKSMHKKAFVFANRDKFITFIRKSLFQQPVAFLRKNFASFRDKITVQFRYRKVVSIIECNHKAPSYCLTLWNNNNLFVGESQLFVHNCGIKHAKGFSGILIMDDPDKPTDIRSEKIREKTHAYYEETLLSRLNNSDTPVLIIQQRLHVDDMTGFLVSRYAFDVFKAPLLAEDGTCNLGNQYTEDRIKELQVNNYVFQAQYQQEPIMLGGGVFHLDWFRYYKNIDDTRYKRIFITADTAIKTKEWNDYTAIGVWGLTIENRLRLLDYVHARFEIPELESTMLAIWDKWRYGIGNCRCSAVWVEDKASGSQIIQLLKRKGGIPIRPVMPNADKLTRALDAVPQVAAGNVELPESENNPLSHEILKDLVAFSADMSQQFDDGVDCLLYAVDAAYSKKGYF